MAKKDRIGSDPLAWIKDTREAPKEGNTVGESEGAKVGKSEGRKVRKPEGVRVGKSEGTKVGKLEGERVGKSESEKKDKKSYSIAKGVLTEVKLLAWYMERSDSAIVEEALKQYLGNNKNTLEKARKLRENK